jgi:hypothetical protein
MRYRLRTLLFALAVLPPLAAAIWLEPVACAFYGFLIGCFIAATFCAVNFKRVVRRAFDLHQRRKYPEYDMRSTIQDLLWLAVAVAMLAGMYLQLTH